MAFLGNRTARSLRLVLIIVAFAGALRVSAQDGHVEDEVKAVFLLNFAKYVGWPPSTFGDRQWAPMHLCLVAASSFIDTVKSAIAGESVDGHPLLMMTPGSAEEARDCHVLYVAKSETLRMRPVLETLRTTRS